MKITTTSKLDRLGWFFPEIITVCGIDHRKFIKIKINQIKRVFLLLFFCEKKPLVIQAMFYFLYFLFYCVYMQFWILSLKKKKIPCWSRIFPRMITVFKWTFFFFFDYDLHAQTKKNCTRIFFILLLYVIWWTNFFALMIKDYPWFFFLLGQIIFFNNIATSTCQLSPLHCLWRCVCVCVCLCVCIRWTMRIRLGCLSLFVWNKY